MIGDGTWGPLIDLAFVACGVALLVFLVQRFRWTTERRRVAQQQAAAAPGVAALLVLDLPVEAADALPFSPAIANATRLAAEFRERDRAVVLSRIDAGAPAQIRVAESGDLVVSTPVQSVFAAGDLDGRLRGRGVDRLVLAGRATGAGIEATTRHAYDLGYGVTIAADAVDESFTERSVLGYADTRPTQEILRSLTDEVR
jgi:hypothetical protein